MTLEKIGEIDTVSVPTDLQIIDNTMYVVEQAGLIIYDITDIANPVQVGEFPDSGTLHGIHVIGDYAFAADLDEGLEIYNVSEFTNIQKVDTYYSGQDVAEVLVQDSVCIVSVDASKLILLNSSDIMDLTTLGEFNITSGMDFQIVDDLIFVTDNLSGLKILNISDPTNPTLVGTYVDGENVRAVNVDQEIAFISCSTDGFKILDISDISSPTLICEIHEVIWGMGHIKQGNLIYVCDYDAGLRVFDVSNLNSPIPYQIYECERVFKVFEDQEYLILLEGGDGLIEILEVIQEPTGSNIDATLVVIIGMIGVSASVIVIAMILKKKSRV